MNQQQIRSPQEWLPMIGLGASQELHPGLVALAPALQNQDGENPWGKHGHVMELYGT